MSEDPILAALARLEAGQEALANRIDRMQHEQSIMRTETRDRFDRLEGKVDRLAADVAHMGPRLSQMETDFGGQYVRAATANTRLDALDTRISLIERRLDVRDQG